MQQSHDDPQELLAITTGETYHLATDAPLAIAAAADGEDQRERCTMEVSAEDRLGL